MSTAVKELLNSFEALPPNEQHEAAVEILRRSAPKGDITDEYLTELADQLFQIADAEEARDAAR